MPKRRSPAKRSPKRRSPAKRSPKRRSPAKRTSKKRSPAKRTSKRRSPAKRTSVKRSPKTSSGGWPMKFVDTISDPNNLMGKPSMFKRTDKYIIYDIPRQYSGMKDEKLYEKMKNMTREEAWNEFRKFKEEQAEIDRQIRQREEDDYNRYGGIDW
jgi:hypothetical protein